MMVPLFLGVTVMLNPPCVKLGDHPGSPGMLRNNAMILDTMLAKHH
jgi:hypothetical protein